MASGGAGGDARQGIYHSLVVSRPTDTEYIRALLQVKTSHAWQQVLVPEVREMVQGRENLVMAAPTDTEYFKALSQVKTLNRTGVLCTLCFRQT